MVFWLQTWVDGWKDASLTSQPATTMINFQGGGDAFSRETEEEMFVSLQNARSQLSDILVLNAYAFSTTMKRNGETSWTSVSCLYLGLVERTVRNQLNGVEEV
jgi:hypothetical protein